MKCEIIRDLLPLCLDGLASRESPPGSRGTSRGLPCLPGGCPGNESPHRDSPSASLPRHDPPLSKVAAADGSGGACHHPRLHTGGGLRFLLRGWMAGRFRQRAHGILRAKRHSHPRFYAQGRRNPPCGQPLGKSGRRLEHRILRAPLLPVRRSGKQSGTLFLGTAYRGSGWKSHSPAAKRGAALSG